MPLNDDTEDEFSTHLQDEHIFDAHAPPGIEMLGLHTETDRGSGSFAENGRVEVAEDETMNNGEMSESSLVGQAASEGQSEIGDWAPEDQAFNHPLNSSVMGQAALDGQSEIGSYAMFGPTEIGQAALDGQSEIGQAALDGQSEIGDWSPENGLSSDVMGSYAMYGSTEIGGVDLQAPFESFMMGPTGIGAEATAPAVVKVVEKARDNRQPPPPMKAVDCDAPIDDGYESDVAEFLIGAAVVTGHDMFPLTTQFMQRAGAGSPPRYVRVDTEESYQQFRADHSAEMRELSDRVKDLAAKLDDHLHDPQAHEMSLESHGHHGGEDDLNADIQDLTILGEEVEAAEHAKRVDLWMPKRYQGLITAWREGANVCASLMLPGKDGTVRVCTSLEPVVKCIDEMSKHAAESGAAETIVGVLPAMGCVLGAGTILKEVAAAAPAILARPEAQGKGSFVVRIEPKVNPAIAALAMLVMACKAGNAQACAEWENLGKSAPAPVRQAMQEAVTLAKAA
jgi:hypothetical protein